MFARKVLKFSIYRKNCGICSDARAFLMHLRGGDPGGCASVQDHMVFYGSIVMAAQVLQRFASLTY